MVDVAAILAEFFGPDDPVKGLSKKTCDTCDNVTSDAKPLNGKDNLVTPAEKKCHKNNKNVTQAREKCDRVIINYQQVTANVTLSHVSHRKNSTQKPNAGEHGPDHDLVARWAFEIERLAALPAASPDAAKALKSARAFIADGWALQAARLGCVAWRSTVRPWPGSGGIPAS